ncbi:hypothetical protein [Haloarchaeobius amylolyticus]|uniref:hypothetical protein n=1 Tax=Haloarchaeobius amylolyticus TaxID=1198296 RepID=UPI00226D85FB|nr:hypothetical protein [Haloarchaeobius amylolyticus]
MQRDTAVVLAALLVTSLVAGIVTANPPRPGTEGNGLTENESATLWSRDADNYISEAEYQRRYGESRTVLHELANGTDITFKRPPATAETWSRNDFTDLAPGGVQTSVHPPTASLTDRAFIRDAHASIFGVHPSTRGHLEDGETPLYIAPSGTLRGFVDYRVRVPNRTTTNNTTIRWSLTDHAIEEVRLTKDGQTIAQSSGDHTPEFDYQIEDDWSTTLAIEADIDVELQRINRTTVGNETNVTVRYYDETVTVSDSIDVEVYDLKAYPHYAEYPNGDTGVSMFQTRPWQGYTLSEDGTARVRGVWRFYTARNTDWDTLVQSTERSSNTVTSDAIPVYVHAYPSRIGPRAEPVLDGPEILNVWGQSRPSPAGSIGENVHIEIVEQEYTTSYGLAVRTGPLNREDIHVAGIVRGVNATIVEPDSGSERQLRESNLTAEVIEKTDSAATVRIELRDNETGAPIALREHPRLDPIGGRTRDGYITIGEQRVETNASGVAILTLQQTGTYTARYHPGSWLSHDPAYVSDTASVRWNPLGTPTWWFDLLFGVSWRLLPFFVTYYAGTRLLRIFFPEYVFEKLP